MRRPLPPAPVPATGSGAEAECPLPTGAHPAIRRQVAPLETTQRQATPARAVIPAAATRDDLRYLAWASVAASLGDGYPVHQIPDDGNRAHP